MQKGLKIFLGLFTLWPPVYLVIFIFMFIQIFFSIMGLGNINESSFFILFGMHIVTMLIIFILMAVYLINVYRNVSVDKDKKILWTILILFGGIIAMPIYWYLFIWKEPLEPSN